MAFTVHTLSHHRLHIQPYNNGRRNRFNGPGTGGKTRDGSHRTAILSTSVAEAGIQFPQAMDRRDGVASHSRPSTFLSLILGTEAGKGAVLERQLVTIQEPR